MANGLGFFVIPEIAFATVSQGRVEFPDRMASSTLVQRGIQQVSLPRNDAHWESMLAWVETFDSEDTAVLAEPRDGGSFRHLSFYLPDYLVYGLGNDKRGKFGHLFTSVENSSDYSIERLRSAQTILEFPDDVEVVLVPAPRLQERLDGVLELEYETLPNDAVVAWAEVPDQDRIVFVGASGAPGIEITGEVDGADQTATVLIVKGSCPVGEEVPIQYARATHEVTAC